VSVVEIQRLATHEGLRLREVRLRALRDAPEAFCSTLADTESRPAESWTEQLAELPTFVAVVAGEDVGMVRVVPGLGAGAGTGQSAATLASLWVAPSARGEGVGEALIDAVITWARATGFQTLDLEVIDDNTPAIALYARKGFSPTGEGRLLPPPRAHVREHRQTRKL
jgi:ribosomal protein S18 acetylase RimI-like enzyme